MSDDSGWTTVQGASGGKRNAKSKYQDGPQRAPRLGPAINLKQKLLDIDAESAWFLSLAPLVRAALVSQLAQFMERHVADMAVTPFCDHVRDMLQQSRATMDGVSQSSCDATQAAAVVPAAPLPFDVVVYGIGRFADWSLARTAELTIDQITPSLVRSALRSASRPPQLQLACIVAVARALTPVASVTSAATSSACVTSVVSAPSASTSRVFMYDPMLSELEKAVAVALGIEIIAENEEGKRQVDRPTLFYMPHCPQTLYNNVLWANWGLGLAHIMVLGNSLRKYVDAYTTSLTVAAASSSSSHGGYLRPSRKKRSAFALKMLADPVCCDHAHEPPPPAASYPYPCLASIDPLLCERAVPNTHDSQTVFNDLALHHFTLDATLVHALRAQSSASSPPTADAALPPQLAAFLTRPPPATMTAEGGVDTEIIAAQLTHAGASTGS